MYMEDDTISTTLANVIFVPWYVKKSMDVNNIDIDVLSRVNMYSTYIKELDKLASEDVVDLCNINGYLTHYLTGYKIYNYDEAKVHELLSVLATEISVENTFTMMYVNNTAIVVLNEGFSNFIKFNDEKFLKAFYSDLINFIFKYFNNHDVYHSDYFKKFLTLINKTK